MIVLDLHMVEVLPVADTFISGLGRIETLRGGALRFTLFAEQQALDSDKIERIVKIRLVMNAEDAMAAAKASILAAMGISGAVGNVFIDMRH